MSLNDILNVARSGMTVSQTAIRTTGNNIANANTPGYSRQRVNIKPMGNTTAGYGLGASVADIHRVHDSFLERQANMYRGGEQFLAGQNLVATQLEGVFNELEDDGINKSLYEFFNSFKDLSLNPASMADRQMVAYKAEQLTSRINYAYNKLENIQQELNLEVNAQLDKGNSLLKELGSLNQKIAGFSDSSGGNEASAMMDRRDEIVRQLHELLDITSFSDDNGAINIMLANHTLVEGMNVGTLSAITGPLNGIQMTTAAGRPIDITSTMQDKEGKGFLNGIISERDVVIEEFKADLDQLAYTMVEQVNLIHASAFALDGSTTRNFFEGLSAVEGAAGMIKVNSEILDDPAMIAVAQDLASISGDNRAAMAIAELANDKTIMGSSSFNDFYAELVGKASNHISHIQSEMDFQGSVVAQADAFRESVSGVSIDEEMVSLLQFQRTFEASAKMIRTVDEMLTTALSLKS